MAILKEKAETDDISKNRIENIQELYNVILEFEKEEADTSLQAFLENLSLSTDLDNLEETDDMVTLMTLHASKGLEYPVVFLIGLEEGIFPSSKSSLDQNELSEERRLCYVGITRAEKKLYITCSERRTVYGKSMPTIISRFIKEIPDDMATKDIEGKKISSGNMFSFENTTKSSFENTFISAEKFLETINKRKNGQKYEEQQVVSHKKFGEGVITKIYQEDDERILEIEFSKVGKKRLVESFAKLDIIR